MFTLFFLGISSPTTHTFVSILNNEINSVTRVCICMCFLYLMVRAGSLVLGKKKKQTNRIK